MLQRAIRVSDIQNGSAAHAKWIRATETVWFDPKTVWHDRSLNVQNERTLICFNQKTEKVSKNVKLSGKRGVCVVAFVSFCSEKQNKKKTPLHKHLPALWSANLK